MIHDVRRDPYAAWLAETSRRWRGAGQDFLHTLATIAPGITTVATNRAAPERYDALMAERDLVLQALKEQGADLEAALNDYVTSTRSCRRMPPTVSCSKP